MEAEKPVRILVDLLPSEVALLDDIKDRYRLRSRGSTVGMLLKSAKRISETSAKIKLPPMKDGKVLA